MQKHVFDLAALPCGLLDAVAAQCDKATLRALCLASRAACAAARRAGSTNIIVPVRHAAKLAAAMWAGRLPAVWAIITHAGSSSCWSPPAALMAVLPRLPTLRMLSMHHTSLGPAGAAQLAACTQLESLRIAHSQELGDAGARMLAAALTRLTALDVLSCGLTADGAAAIAALPRLQVLNISCNPVGEAGGAALGALTALACLFAWDVGCPQLLQHLRDVTRLELLLAPFFWGRRGVPVADERVAVESARAHVTALTSMRRLCDLSGPPLDDSAAALLSGALTALTTLTSHKAQGLTGPGLAALGRLPLKRLHLGCARARGAAPAGLSPLAPTLGELELEQAGVDDEGAAAIARLTGLTSLSVRANRVTRAGVASLASGLAGLRKLDLSYNPAGAASVGPLSALTALSWLAVNFRYGNNSDTSGVALHALRRCTGLVTLRLMGGDGLSDGGRAALEDWLPQVGALSIVQYDPPSGGNIDSDEGGEISEQGDE